MSAPAEWRQRSTRVEPVPLIGCSILWAQAVRLAELYAPTKLPILLVGATGTGKEVLAQHIHYLSRRTGELIDVNCGAIPHEMTESLLFGHRRGAFTGALEDSVGLVAQAADGTLFLDELSSMSPGGQAKLLRVLETGELRPLGDQAKHRVDFRVIGAVQDNVRSLLEGRLLRADLYHRVASVVIRLPCLQERMEDVRPLATYFAALHGLTLTDDALRVLVTHDWPGNVRELRAVLDRAAVLTNGRQIAERHLADALNGFEPLPSRGSAAGPPDGQARHRLLEVCKTCEGNREQIARAIGVSRATLYRRLKAAGIELASVKGREVRPSHSSHAVSETA